jgi:phosphoribosylformylglycinamidine cyclo-ligase
MLQVHRSYLPALRPLLPHCRALAHITGGGLPGNLNRALPATLDALVDTASWTVPSLFRVLGDAGQVPLAEQFRAFNMGVGMVAIVEPAQAGGVMAALRGAGVDAWELGRVVPGTGRVQLDGVAA